MFLRIVVVLQWVRNVGTVRQPFLFLHLWDRGREDLKAAGDPVSVLESSGSIVPHMSGPGTGCSWDNRLSVGQNASVLICLWSLCVGPFGFPDNMTAWFLEQQFSRAR